MGKRDVEKAKLEQLKQDLKWELAQKVKNGPLIKNLRAAIAIQERIVNPR